MIKIIIIALIADIPFLYLIWRIQRHDRIFRNIILVIESLNQHTIKYNERIKIGMSPTLKDDYYTIIKVEENKNGI